MVLVVLVPPVLVTVTSTVPVPAGAVALIVVSLMMVKVAVVVPNLTADAPVKLVPVIVTAVPPVLVPDDAERCRSDRH